MVPTIHLHHLNARGCALKQLENKSCSALNAIGNLAGVGTREPTSVSVPKDCPEHSGPIDLGCGFQKVTGGYDSRSSNN